jgi:cytochrome b561
MPARNSPEHWGWVAQFLHWTMALMIIGLAIVGLAMDEMANSPDKLKVYALHKSTGLTVLALALLRLLWRFVDPRPPYPATMPRWQRVLSEISHGLLYVFMIGMPLSGWLYNSASNFPLQWFGLFQVLALSGPDPELKHLAHDIHERGLYVIATLLAIHVGAALKHHFVDRDATLARMTPGVRAPRSVPENP